MERRHYSKAPITEAVIDLRVALPASVDLAQLGESTQLLGAGFQRRRKLTATEASIRFEPQSESGPKVSTDATSVDLGWAFVSADERHVCQVTTKGFTFSRLAPYERWESFREDARKYWEAYRRQFSPERIERIAVRYINRLDLPLPFDDFKVYLRTTPEVSPNLRQELASLFMRVHIPYPDSQSELILTLATMTPSDPAVVPVVLDIDLWRTASLPQDDSAIWTLFELLHESENRIFEACITDEFRRLIT